jgi:prepilin-type N-terminal cleavage/methylation domain-containing protein
MAGRVRGFTLLELTVAMMLLGIALSGLMPLVAINSRGLRSLEARVIPGGTCYLIPSSDPWVRKLGASATITEVDPGPAARPPVLLVDDDDAGFDAAGGGWLAQTDAQAGNGRYHLHASDAPPGGEGSPASPETVTWQFNDVPPGRYHVQATWLAGPDRAPDARYTVFDGTTSLGSYDISQLFAPSGPVSENRPWQVVADVPLGSGTVQVTLKSSPNGTVAADAVQLVPVANDVEIVSLARTMATDEVTVRVTVEVPP